MAPPRVPLIVNPRTTASDAGKRSKRHDHATCDRPPASVDGLTATYDKAEGHRHEIWVLKVRWNEVTTDTLGNPIRLRRYVLEWQYSKDDGAHWHDSGRHNVPAKDDDDDNSKDHFTISKIKGRYDYRYRVRGEAKGGCLGAWSSWYDAGPAIETPPEVTNLTLDVDEHSARGTWNLPDDEDNPDVKDIRITHVMVQLWRGAKNEDGPVGKTFTVGSEAAMLALGAEKWDVAFRTDDHKTYQATSNSPNTTGEWTEINLVAFDRHRVSEHWHTKLTQPPREITYHLLVRTKAASGSVSDWVETTATKDTPSQPAAPAITFDALGTRHNRYRAKVLVAEVADTDFEIAKYHVQWVDKRNAGTPDNNDDRRHHTVRAKGTNRELATVFNGIPSAHFTYARTQAVDKDNKESAWSSWQAGGKPSASDTVPALTNLTYITARRRVGVKWKVPQVNNMPDERIAFVEGQIATDNGFLNLVDEWQAGVGHHSHRYAVPADQVGTQYFVRIRSLDAAANVGAWQPSNTGQPLTGEADSGLPDAPGGPANPSVSFDVQGTRHARYRATVVPGRSSTGGTPDQYRLQLAHASTSGANPPAGTKRHSGGVDADDTGDNFTEVWRNIPKRHFVWVRERAVNAGGKSAWTGWISAGRPVDSGATSTPPTPTGLSVTSPAPRRLRGEWAEPDDDEAVRWSVVVKRGATTMETVTVRNNHHVYRVPKADVGVSHSMVVTAVNDMGGLSATSTAAASPLDDDVTGTPGVGVEAGHMKFWSGPIKASWSKGNSGDAHYFASGAPWILCDGGAYSTSSYPDLFAAVGYTNGGSGSSFNVPDMRKRGAHGAADDVEVGTNDGQAVADRDQRHHEHGAHQTHGGHNAHDGHNPHGNHTTHGAHNGHGDHDSHHSEATHKHQTGSFTTQAGSTAASHTRNAAADHSQSQVLSLQAHTHVVQSFQVATGDSHGGKHDEFEGVRGHPGHIAHGSHSEHGVGEHDSSPNVRGHSDHSTHNAHAEHNPNEHDEDHPNQRGHRDHPNHKGHWVIRSSDS